MAGSKLVTAQAIWDDPDDRTKSKKTGFTQIRVWNPRINYSFAETEVRERCACTTLFRAN